MGKYILAIDQGTTGTTSILVDANNYQFLDAVNIEFEQHFPKPSWVEHDLNEIWSTVEKGITKLLSKNNLDAKEITSIGITNQRETTCAYTKEGNPLTKAIVWQDRRTQEFCEQNKDKFNSFTKVTGLPLDAYFSSTKMRWLLKNNSDVQAANEKGNLLFSTIETFILYKLTNGISFFTEPTNASRTNLMSLDNCSWNDELLDFFSVPKECLPEIKETFSDFGKTQGLSFLPDGISINCLIGDQQSALFGQACTQKGQLKCTYGTGAFLLLNTGHQIERSENGLLSTVAFKYQGNTTYALEGSSYIAGAAVQWLRDKLDILESSPQVEELAENIKNLEEMEHIQFLPFFTGIGSPHWVSDAKAAIVGLTRDSNRNHISRACLEGIALSIKDLIEAFTNDGGEIKSINVDGGAANNNLLLQIQSNFTNLEIVKPKNVETTALGAVFGAAVGSGILHINEISSYWAKDKTITPEQDLSYYQMKSKKWKEMINRLFLT